MTIAASDPFASKHWLKVPDEQRSYVSVMNNAEVKNLKRQNSAFTIKDHELIGADLFHVKITLPDGVTPQKTIESTEAQAQAHEQTNSMKLRAENETTHIKKAILNTGMMAAESLLRSTEHFIVHMHQDPKCRTINHDGSINVQLPKNLKYFCEKNFGEENVKSTNQGITLTCSAERLLEVAGELPTPKEHTQSAGTTMYRPAKGRGKGNTFDSKAAAARNDD